MKIIDLTEKIRSDNFIEEKILSAVCAIKSGGLVIFPTETVYGLGADCFNKTAVKKIFITKKRPFNDPLIVHISDKKQLFLLTEKVDQRVKSLIENFWPGPLSIVVKKTSLVPDIVTAGKDTVCIRMPKNVVAKKFIQMCQTPIAAPSANLFSRVSSTHIDHIVKDFSDTKNIDYVIYDGYSFYGMESTIIDCTEYPFKVLRYGSIPIFKIKEKTKLIIKEKNLFKKTEIKVPGMFKKHYAPSKETFLARNIFKYVKEQKDECIEKVMIICSDNTQKKLLNQFGFNIKILSYGNNFSQIAKKLYYILRLAEQSMCEKIVIEPVANRGLGKTILDRIIRASEGKFV